MRGVRFFFGVVTSLYDSIFYFHCSSVVLLLSVQSAVLVMELLTTPEPNLLVNAICAMKAVFTFAVMHSILIQRYGDIRDQLDNLLVHPIQQIADLACSLEDIVSNYADRMEDEDGCDEGNDGEDGY